MEMISKIFECSLDDGAEVYADAIDVVSRSEFVCTGYGIGCRDVSSIEEPEEDASLVAGGHLGTRDPIIELWVISDTDQ